MNAILVIYQRRKLIMKSRPILAAILLLTSVASAQVKPPREQAIDRFLRYVKIDTQSKEDQTTVPSTRKQIAVAFTPDEEVGGTIGRLWQAGKGLQLMKFIV